MAHGRFSVDTGFENGNHGVRLLALVRSRHSEDGKKTGSKSQNEEDYIYCFWNNNPWL